MHHLLDPADRHLPDWLTARGEPAFRARQLREWIFQNRTESLAECTNLPLKLRQALAEDFQLWTTKIARRKTSDDGTEKLLLELTDGGRIECVLLRDGERRTICISTQVGCAMGCVFCASGIGGVIRNLTPGEIIEQMLRLDRLLPDDERLSHIVVMGMGEPLANLDALLAALAEATSPTGLGISQRRITISTVGIPAAIRRLARGDGHFNLAVSLHAPNDELRNRLVPVNDRIGISDILAAADEYFDASGRRLTFEYVLLAEINDRVEHAEELARLLRGRLALLNLIPYNPVAGLPYRTPSQATQARFIAVLRSAGMNVQVRQRKGDAIDAACGQLRREHDAAPIRS